MSDPTVLLISGDAGLIRTVRSVKHEIENLHLEVHGHLEDAHPRLGRDDVALVLLHHTAATDDALATRLLWAAAAANRPVATVLLSDGRHPERTAALLRAGAADCLPLPVQRKKLGHLVEVLALRAAPPAAADALADLARREPGFYVLAPEMAELMEQVRRVVPQSSTILLTGETGTGKTRLARIIHELSPRRDEPFLVVNCGALSASLIESEMFGHVRGAFTGADRDHQGKFAAAGRGTLLLDEVDALAPAVQAKLLRAVDERVFEPVGSNTPQPLQARLVAASNVPLDQEVAAGRFRPDLYYRLNVVEFFLPPLRDRRCVVPAMAQRLLAEFSERNGRAIRSITPDALLALEQYDWPGNVRELRNVVERAVALCPGPDIEVSDLPEAVRRGDAWDIPCPDLRRAALRSAPATLSQSREETEVLRITAALRKHRNNRLRAAAELGISRMALYKKLHKYGLMHTA